MKYRVMEILENCGFDAAIGISVLMDKSLITIEIGQLQMHDLLQEMGREIIRRESEEPGNRSRLWLCEDLLHVLTNNTVRMSKLEFFFHILFFTTLNNVVISYFSFSVKFVFSLLL